MAETDGTTTKNTSRRPFWEKHLRAWAQSGLTQADDCRQHPLSAPAFGWWKRQLEGKPSTADGSRWRVFVVFTRRAQDSAEPEYMNMGGLGAPCWRPCARPLGFAE